MMAREGRVLFGLGAHEAPHDPRIFDGTDEEISALFYASSHDPAGSSGISASGLDGK
jgi:hypothetical protein